MIEIEIIQEELIDVTVENEIEVEVVIPETEIIVKEAPKYTGAYTVTPDVEPITLQTKDKVMTDDVTVFKIPLWEVSNPFGGTTIYIGGEEVYGEK